MNFWWKMRYILILIIIFNFSLSFSNENDKCLRCHKSGTLSILDIETKTIKSYHVDPDKFSQSNHKDLNCTTCHSDDYSKWPHPDTLEINFTCISCHSENSVFIQQNPEFSDKFADVPIKHIYNEFEQSVHRKEFGDKFDCFSCHDPHSFERNRKPTPEKIKKDNAMCLNCHKSEYAKGVLKDVKMPVIEVTHQWLPNTKLHWDKVRCIDCHTSYDGENLSHNIMPKEKAVKNCESCHTQNTMLLTKLYRYEQKHSQEEYGFVNGTLLSDAYVIGSTRNKLLDNLSLIVFGMTFLGLFTHGFLRWKTRDKKNKK